MNLFLDPSLCLHCKEEKRVKFGLCSFCLKKLKKIHGRKELKGYSCSFPLLYLGELKRILYQYKFRRKIYYKDFLAEVLLEEVERIGPDLLVPIPLSKRKLYQRGFQQVEIVCKILTKKTNIPTVSALEKVRHTKDQHLISPRERRTNLSGAFQLAKDISGKNILLVDDITTTGITFLEGAKELEKGHPKSIQFLALAGTDPEEFKGEEYLTE